MKTDFERAQARAPPAGRSTSALALRSTPDAPAERPHLSVHLVLDVSGSMAGESINRAREAAPALVDKLDRDRRLLAGDVLQRRRGRASPDGPVGARRAQIKKTIDAIVEGGGTNIGRGLELGYARRRSRHLPEDAVRGRPAPSDGRANVGMARPRRRSHASRSTPSRTAIQTSSFGLGADYDGALMSAIAAMAPAATTTSATRRRSRRPSRPRSTSALDPVATAVEVRVRLEEGRRAAPGRVRLAPPLRGRGGRASARMRSPPTRRPRSATASRRTAQDDAEGGMRFFIPAFARDDTHSLLLKLARPAGVGQQRIASSSSSTRTGSSGRT